MEEEYAKTLKDLQAGKNEDGDCGYPMDTAPSWLDRERFRRGRDFAMKHISALVLSMFCSLATGLSIVNLLDPLVFTGKSNTPAKAYDRYMRTFNHIVNWFMLDVWDTTSEGHKSAKLVREMHHHVRNQMNAVKPHSDFKYLSQYDMAVVQSGFMGAVVMYPRNCGMRCTQEELEDYVFFWRGIGYLLGVNDKYNMCAGGYDETYNLCKEIEHDLLLPALATPPQDFDSMLKAFIDGTNKVSGFKLMSVKAVLSFSLHIMQRHPGKLFFWDKLRVWFLKTTVFCIYWIPGVEYLANWDIMRTLHSFNPK